MIKDNQYINMQTISFKELRKYIINSLLPSDDEETKNNHAIILGICDTLINYGSSRKFFIMSYEGSIKAEITFAKIIKNNYKEFNDNDILNMIKRFKKGDLFSDTLMACIRNINDG